MDTTMNTSRRLALQTPKNKPINNTRYKMAGLEQDKRNRFPLIISWTRTSAPVSTLLSSVGFIVSALARATGHSGWGSRFPCFPTIILCLAPTLRLARASHPCLLPRCVAECPTCQRPNPCRVPQLRSTTSSQLYRHHTLLSVH